MFLKKNYFNKATQTSFDKLFSLTTINFTVTIIDMIFKPPEIIMFTTSGTL